jgi:hypothetical protein
MDRACFRRTVVLCSFAAIFIALTVGSYTQESATVDEPQHLTAGYTALRLGDYRIDPEHPPFLRLWAAMPLLVMRNVQFDTNTLAWQTADAWPFSHNFLYGINDADRLLYRARFMTAVLGVILGVLVFCWAEELFGVWTASAVLALVLGRSSWCCCWCISCARAHGLASLAVRANFGHFAPGCSR